jgi:putative restriction endonuclease
LPQLSKHQMFNILLDGITRAGSDYIIVGAEHPFTLSVLLTDNDYMKLRVYIWNIGHGGGAGRPTDEYRIQVTGYRSFLHDGEFYPTILGWYEGMGVFAAFDYSYHVGELGYSSSIQVKIEALRKASIDGFSYTVKSNGETVYAFKPDYFLSYLEVLDERVELPTNQEENEKILEAIVSQSEEEAIATSPEGRKEVTRIVRKAYRRCNFRDKVLTVYNRTCAFCGLQLELIDAAHIIPVSDPRSNDSIFNGIALCRNHHKAYDAGLTYIEEDYSIQVNNNVLASLEEKRLLGGLDYFKEGLREIAIVPTDENLRPKPEYIRIGSEIRGITS